MLYEIQKQVITSRKGRWNKREEAVITRLRTGHTLSKPKSQIREAYNWPICSHCYKTETVENYNFRGNKNTR